jgi:hypothetical protein
MDLRSIHPFLLYVFMSWDLVQHRDNITGFWVPNFAKLYPEDGRSMFLRNGGTLRQNRHCHNPNVRLRKTLHLGSVCPANPSALYVNVPIHVTNKRRRYNTKLTTRARHVQLLRRRDRILNFILVDVCPKKPGYLSRYSD